jgi:hypothetical protein
MPLSFITFPGQMGGPSYLLFSLLQDLFGGLLTGWISLAHNVDFTAVLRARF